MSEINRQKILFVLPRLTVIGGGEAVAVWMLQALRDEYDLSVMTWTASVENDDINRVYGTSLRRDDLKVLGPPRLLRTIFDLVARWKPEHHFQKACLLCRLTQRRKKDYDILISGLDEVDFGRPGIQYIHFPNLAPVYQLETAARDRGFTSRWWHLFKQRYRPWRILSGFSFERVKENLTLVNSDWTGAVVRQLYGIDSLTIYPPVAGVFSDIAWEERRDSFVCIGRFTPHKRIEMVIEILAAVRALGHDIQLQLIGLLPDDPADREYYRKIRNLACEHASWISMVEKIDLQQLAEIVSHSRYGIHGAEVEPFGIAVAEMVRAGCIAFTGSVGGQREIIGHEERLIFDTVEEGIRKILAVLRSPEQQAALREFLAERRNLFDSDRFVMQIKRVVRQFQMQQLFSGTATPDPMPDRAVGE
jgi:glycosyltransferase involved in cell wall biosynthesis